MFDEQSKPRGSIQLSERLTQSLRLAITVDPEIPVPPKLYGGIERIVYMLVRGLVERGHSVTLFANADSDVPCNLLPYSGKKSQVKTDSLKNMWQVSSVLMRGRFDLVHSFARLAYLLPVLPLSLPKIMSYQRGMTPRTVLWGNRLSRGSLHFTACSQHILRSSGANGNSQVIYNAAPLGAYEFSKEVSADAPLVFLGRIESIKGTHLAIEVARRAKRTLVIAGNIPEEPEHRSYFDKNIAPYINGESVQYVGPVNDSEKNELLGRSAALLMPILWDEPFGIVMAEALACGTPVIGLNRGAVSEVVQSGVNGFVCESVEEMAEKVKRVKDIDRQECRRMMEEKFSDRAMVDAYEALYLKLIAHRRH